MLKCCLVALSLSALAASSLLAGKPASAMEDAMMSPKMDCAKAPEMLSNAEKMGYTTAYTGEIDRIVLPMVMDREKSMNMMLKVEADCGKDPKMKAMAAKALIQSDERMKQLEMASKP